MSEAVFFPLCDTEYHCMKGCEGNLTIKRENECHSAATQWVTVRLEALLMGVNTVNVTCAVENVCMESM